MSSSIEIEKKIEELRKWKTKISVADQDPGFGAFLTPESGSTDPGQIKIQSQDPGSWMSIPDLIFRT